MQIPAMPLGQLASWPAEELSLSKLIYARRVAPLSASAFTELFNRVVGRERWLKVKQTRPLGSFFGRFWFAFWLLACLFIYFGKLAMWTHCKPKLSNCEVWLQSLGQAGNQKCKAWGKRPIAFSKGWNQQVEAMDQKCSSQHPRELFARKEIGVFCQEQPRIGNPYLEDAFLQDYLKSQLPAEVFADESLDLEQFGARVKDEIDLLGRECEINPPQLKQFDAWGRHVDEIITCPAWKRMKEISAEEGLIAEAYERRYSNWSRIHQIAKLYLFAPSSGLFSCPLAMTDGAAKVIESLGIPKPLKEVFIHLTSRDPAKFWTSGQWMTERRGGSDVASGTETVALELPDGSYSLHGLKWFTSATDSDITLTLARTMTADGQIQQGSQGLSLFYLKMRDEEGKLNGIEIQRLKDKLGTRQLPTAELLLNGAKSLKISAEGRGVASIVNMMTITRIHNVIYAVACMRRVITLAKDYATKREAFGKPLKAHPLHMQTLARMEVQARGAFLLMMEIGKLLGLEETKKDTEQDQHMLRLLTPVVKLYTGKQAVAVTSEGLECFGGQGYMEDTGLAGILRDAQVLTIWEGTTNILSLDVLRSLVKSQGKVLDAFFSTVQARLKVALSVSELELFVQMVQNALHKLRQFTQKISLKGEAGMQLSARDFAYALARTYGGVLLLEYAARPNASATDIYSAQRWCHQDMCPVDSEDKAGSYSTGAASLDTSLVYDKHPVLKGRL
ncbi:acyl-CoA dehydrogenase family member 11-like isoform X1 [Podarcis raffonei]|uniref:acyl-CoA dehydrogenase family member 11-like isoform X1 n=1 Tax=Podarcis raffonei TaxID=65483 RepID=UPI002329470C|nr:acyl-CoA dehydrogenase family member 11-like isoform X1 [Podarcis raffonei]